MEAEAQSRVDAVHPSLETVECVLEVCGSLHSLDTCLNRATATLDRAEEPRRRDNDIKSRSNRRPKDIEPFEEGSSSRMRMEGLRTK